MAPPKGLAQSEFMEYVKFGALELVSIVSPLSELRIVHRLSCWVPDFVRKVLKIFQIFCQPSGPVGKQNQPVHLVQFAGTAVWVV